jgi:hypothetical protein
VRTHSRSYNSRLALAGLGVMAALVAVASDAQPTRPADAAVRDETPSEIVRGVDFTTVGQPGDTCADALADSPPRRIPVEHGTSRLLDEQSLVRLDVRGDVHYGDLDGDGVDEAVVHAVCNYGANGTQDTVQVWTVDIRVPVLVATVTGPPEAVADDSRFPPSVHDVEIDGSRLAITFTHHAEDDPNCCPSEQRVVTYELGDDLEAVGRPVTSPIEP